MRRTPLMVAAMLVATSTAMPTFAHGPNAHHAANAAVVKEQQDWGIAGDAADARRTVEVRMGDDMRFIPAELTVREGETVRFRVHNAGQAMHEFVIGTDAALDEHAALMVRFPDMAHDEPWMAHIPPGQSGEIVWTFNRPGRFGFACLIAGHYQAGMRGTLTVSAKGASQ